jgi:uncharacterized protein YecT (DUF1311 family)
MRSILTMLVILTATFSAHASPSNKYTECMEENSSTMGMKMCAGDEIVLQTGRMKAALKKTTARLNEYKTDKDLDAETIKQIEADNKEIIARMNKAQKAFIIFRDAQCDYEGAAMLGGTGESLLTMGCLATMTGDRADALERELASQN